MNRQERQGLAMLTALLTYLLLVAAVVASDFDLTSKLLLVGLVTAIVGIVPLIFPRGGNR